MSKKKPAPLLLAEDIALEPDHEKRSSAVKSCAVKLAQKLNASIDLVHVEDMQFYSEQATQYKAFINPYFKELKAKLTSIANSLPLPTKALFLNGEPIKKILSLSNKRNAYEMIVLGTHGRTGLRRLILGSVAEEVIRQSKIPVMTIGPKAQEKSSEFLTNSKIKILIPTGLTPNSERAETYGVALAHKLDAEVVFFHSILEALHPVLQTAFMVPTPPPQITEFFEEIKVSSLNSLLNKVKKAKKQRVSAMATLDDKTLSSSEAVLKEASRVGASLIVLGTHGRSMVSSAFFGRTARDVILGASTPVVTVHSKKS